MKVFLGIFMICFLVLMLTLEPILRNTWVLIAAIAAVMAAVIPPAVALSPPVSTPRKPSWPTASFTPFARE